MTAIKTPQQDSGISEPTAAVPVVTVDHLRKTYANGVGVQDVSFSVGRGEIFGITGLDPQARRETWELIEHVRDRGVTVILVTHYMEEAERLCDRVLLIDQGTVTALDTPAGLAQSAGGGTHLRFVPSIPFADQVLTTLPEVTEVGHEGQRIRVSGTGDLVSAVIRALEGAGVQAQAVQVESATLDDAYVRLIHHDREEAVRP